MTELEPVASCPVCGGILFPHYLSTKDFSVTGEPFNILKCATCELGITSPRPTQKAINRYYESPNYISHTGGTGTLTDRIYKLVRTYTTRRKLDLISRFDAPTGTLLDYGCGTGNFLRAAYQRKWICTGVEPSAEARKRIGPGIPVYEHLHEIDSQFDVITLWHVLEHIHNLEKNLAELRRRLRPGGIIFIAVPNHESYDAVHYAQYWAGYDVPRHLWHFNKRAMTQLLVANGFDFLAIKPMKFDAYYVSLLSESYKTKKTTVLNTLKATAIGFWSNATAGPDNHSSLIYIARS